MDEGLTKGVVPQELPPITLEDFKEISELFEDLSLNLHSIEEEQVFKTYTGIDMGVGSGTVYHNSKMTLRQLLYSLAMTRHPLVKKIANIHTLSREKFNARSLVENKIMSGMKILDLGCGSMPVFARCCRAMGADVWTVDLIPAGNFEYKDKLITQKERNTEIQKHIQLDLTKKNSTDIIQEISKGDFDLVIVANLRPAGFSRGKQIAWPLLKKGAIFCSFDLGDVPELKE